VGVAQLVELLVVVQAVVGSSPIAHPSLSSGNRLILGIHAKLSQASAPSICWRKCAPDLPDDGISRGTGLQKRCLARVIDRCSPNARGGDRWLLAFLAGPPLIGFLAEHTGALGALTATAGSSR
jgi:hypothetical protein